MPKPNPDHVGQTVLWAGSLVRPKEQDLVNACLDWCATHPVLVPKAWRNNSGVAWRGHIVKVPMLGWILRGLRKVLLAPAGSPDIVGWLAHGRFLAIECKRDAASKLRPEQEEFLAAIHRDGGLALVVRDVEELDRDIRRAVAA